MPWKDGCAKHNHHNPVGIHVPFTCPTRSKNGISSATRCESTRFFNFFTYKKNVSNNVCWKHAGKKILSSQTLYTLSSQWNNIIRSVFIPASPKIIRSVLIYGWIITRLSVLIALKFAISFPFANAFCYRPFK